MRKSALRRILSHLNHHAFESFAVELFSSRKQSEPFKKLPEGGDGAYYQPILDSYGGSLHSVFLLHYSPLELLKNPKGADIEDPVLIRRLTVIRDLYKGRIGYWGIVSPSLRKASCLRSVAFITNLVDIDRHVYDEEIVPAYAQLARAAGLKKPLILVGSYDSFVERVPAETDQAAARFIEKNHDGIRIVLGAEQAKVERFVSERTLSGGVLRGTHDPYEPVFGIQRGGDEEALAEFERLIQSGAAESKLEKFIVAHYKDIFGARYDRVEAQLWIRFPDLDVSRSQRRMDIFLRNSVANDWELFEIKRSGIRLTSTYRDAPVIAAEVKYAAQQLKNYARTLAQDSVRRHFAGQGIEYYEPSLSLVVGRTPQIPHQQWRWLLSTNEDRVKILTFDNLLAEMKSRLNDRNKIVR
jgi:Domain of unknown function (DUF4263)